MEDLDSIILPILRDIGCNLDDVASVKDFKSEQIYHVAAMCLNAINPDGKIPEAMPGNNAARFRVTTTAANAVKDLGFTGEIGYQTFLYPNEAEIRKLVSFLVDKVPRVERADEDRDAGAGASAALSTKINSALAAFTQTKWSLLNTSARRAGDSLAPFSTVPLSLPSADASNPAREAYCAGPQPLVSSQPPAPARALQTAPSLFELTARDVVLAERDAARLEPVSAEKRAAAKAALAHLVSSSLRAALAEKLPSARGRGAVGRDAAALAALNAKFSSAFSRKTDFAQEKDDADGGLTKEELDARAREEREALEAARAAELAALQAELDRHLAEARRKELEAEAAANELRQLEAALADAARAAAELEQQRRVKQRVIDLLPNAAENVGKLQQLADDNARKALLLGAEWAKIRTPLVEEYRAKRLALRTRKDEIAAKVEEIKRMRAAMKEMVQEVKAKDEEYAAALAELNALPKSINRQVYIRRINDIMKNVAGQKEDIAKILDDVRTVQREIAAKGEAVKRSFDLADELVYRTAKVKKDPTAIQVYRHIVALRSGFNEIVETVESGGRRGAKVRELEQHIESHEARNTNLNLERVTEDLAQVQKENAELKDKLRTAARAGAGAGAAPAGPE